MEMAMALMETVVENEEEQYERLAEVFKYKRVANKVQSVELTLPEEYLIQPQKHLDPFATMPELVAVTYATGVCGGKVIYPGEI